jgi:hypothetical protein
LTACSKSDKQSIRDFVPHTQLKGRVMATNSTSEISRDIEQEQHWHYTAAGLGWVKLGVQLLALSVILLLLVGGAQHLIAAPRNPGANRAMSEGLGILFLILAIGALGSSILGIFGVIIGLTMSAFAPRPLLAKFFALGAVLLFIKAQVSLGQGALVQTSLMQEGIAEQRYFWFRVFAEVATNYISGICEYFLALVLGACLMLALAAEFRERELTRLSHGFVKLLFVTPALALALGVCYGAVNAFQNQDKTLGPLLIAFFSALIYLFVSYRLLSVLTLAIRTIQSVLQPDYWPLSPSPAKPVVIDPLAD